MKHNTVSPRGQQPLPPLTKMLSIDYHLHSGVKALINKMCQKHELYTSELLILLFLSQDPL